MHDLRDCAAGSLLGTSFNPVQTYSNYSPSPSNLHSSPRCAKCFLAGASWCNLRNPVLCHGKPRFKTSCMNFFYRARARWAVWGVAYISTSQPLRSQSRPLPTGARRLRLRIPFGMLYLCAFAYGPHVSYGSMQTDASFSG